MGIPINYDAFSARWDEESMLSPEQQILHKLVDRFDGNGLVLKTQDTQDQVGQQSQEEKPGEVSKMAKRATKLGK